MHILNHFAYLDAGTGSLIVQSLVGIFAGVTVFGRKLISGIGRKFSNLFKHSKSDQVK